MKICVSARRNESEKLRKRESAAKSGSCESWRSFEAAISYLAKLAGQPAGANGVAAEMAASDKLNISMTQYYQSGVASKSKSASQWPILKAL
jgi:hypothetical protein